MDTVVRFTVIVGAIGLVFVLLFLNKYVVERYWLPAIVDEDGEE